MDTKLLWQTTHKLFLNAEVREGEQLYAQPPEGLEPEDSDGWQTCRVEGAQGHARLANISVALAGTLVKQVERTRFHSRRARSLFVCERGTGHLHRGTGGRHAGSATKRVNEKAVAGTREGHGNALGVW